MSESVGAQGGVNAPAPPLLEVLLVSIGIAAAETKLFELRRVDGQPLPSVAPGAHIDVHLPSGLVRQYSITTAEDRPQCYRIGVKRDEPGRGGSREMHDELMVGTTLRISPPRNNFALVEDALHSVLIAGGIGITPIWSMVQRLAASRRSWELHYSCRTRSHAAFLTEIEALGDRVHLHFDDEADGRLLDLRAIVAAAPEDSHLYCCGPTPMLSAFEEAVGTRPAELVHVEYFTAREAAATEGGYVVELRASGREFFIPAGKTILDVLREAGIPVNHSCEIGVCGTCETRLIEGTPDHRDEFLTPVERAGNKTIMICCSGSLGPRLVLDL